MKRTLSLVVGLALTALTSSAVTVDFDGLGNEYTFGIGDKSLGDVYAAQGVTMEAGARIWDPADPLFRSYFPPKSGNGALMSEGPMLTLHFNNPVKDTSFFYTLTGEGFRVFGLDQNDGIVGAFTSTYSGGVLGQSEPMAIQWGTPVNSVVILSGGLDYIIDDLSFSPVVERVPEVGSTLMLLGLAGVALGVIRRRV